ncbi:Membrane protein insertase YidC [Buchnera aphidicola (Takecallis arundicolens)]|uniref:membrane protein insertase YidC n=1 Tax=Buchnera aphidicola TaxID=9 RepID=UPI0034643B5B
MRLKHFFLIFILLLCSLFLWKLWTIKLYSVSFKKTQIQYDISEQKNQFNKIKIVDVKTDVMDVKINLFNGEIYQGRLLNYQEQLTRFKKLELINQKHDEQKIISGLICNNDHIFNLKKDVLYKTNVMHFKMLNGKKILFVPIVLDINNNLHIVKTFIFKKGSYDIGIEYKIYNHNIHPLSYYIYSGLKQKLSSSNVNSDMTSNQFENIAYSQDNEKYKKCLLSEMKNQQYIHYVTQGGWIALLKKYFSIAWFLNNSEKNTVHITNKNNQDVIFWYKTSHCVIFPEKKSIKRTIFWFGPKIQSQMSHIAPYFDCTIEYGWFWFLSKPLFYLLNILHDFVNNWGYAIILITCIIRVITYPLIKSQYLATIKMKLLQPEIHYIKQKFKNDRKKLNEKILKLYQKSNINPFSGLLPILLQMPVFLALYYMLVNTVELRHAPFIFWINDLSAQDPLYILPVIMGITIFIMQKTAPSNYFPLSLQEKIINFSPIVFVCFFFWFPSGLVLYYTISNLVTILQQIVIHHTLKNHIKL